MDKDTEAARRRIVGDWLSRRLDDLAPLGKSRTGLARAIGIPQPRISEILRGARRIQGHEIDPMAAYLECPPHVISALAAGSIAPILRASGADGDGHDRSAERDWHARLALDLLASLPRDVAWSVLFEAARRIGVRQTDLVRAVTEDA